MYILLLGYAPRENEKWEQNLTLQLDVSVTP